MLPQVLIRTKVSRRGFRRIRRKATDATTRALFRIGGLIRSIARRSILRRKSQSSPGQPPHTQTGRLKDAILFVVERLRGRVIIGPEAREVGPTGGAHEFGGKFREQDYPKRPFMGPALEKADELGAIPAQWSKSVK